MKTLNLEIKIINKEDY